MTTLKIYEKILVIRNNREGTGDMDKYQAVKDLREEYIRQYSGTNDDYLTYKDRSGVFDSMFIGALYSVIHNLCYDASPGNICENAEETADKLIVNAAQVIAGPQVVTAVRESVQISETRD